MMGYVIGCSSIHAAAAVGHFFVLLLMAFLSPNMTPLFVTASSTSHHHESPVNLITASSSSSPSSSSSRPESVTMIPPHPPSSSAASSLKASGSNVASQMLLHAIMRLEAESQIRRKKREKENNDNVISAATQVQQHERHEDESSGSRSKRMRRIRGKRQIDAIPGSVRSPSSSTSSSSRTTHDNDTTTTRSQTSSPTLDHDSAPRASNSSISAGAMPSSSNSSSYPPASAAIINDMTDVRLKRDEAEGPGSSGAFGRGMAFFVGEPCARACSSILFHVYCNLTSKRCECNPGHPVNIRGRICAKVVQLNEDCLHSESCEASDPHSFCSPDQHKCRCKGNYRATASTSLRVTGKEVSSCEPGVFTMNDHIFKPAIAFAAILFLFGLFVYLLLLMRRMSKKGRCSSERSYFPHQHQQQRDPDHAWCNVIHHHPGNQDLVQHRRQMNHRMPQEQKMQCMSCTNRNPRSKIPAPTSTKAGIPGLPLLTEGSILSRKHMTTRAAVKHGMNQDHGREVKSFPMPRVSKQLQQQHKSDSCEFLASVSDTAPPLKYASGRHERRGSGSSVKSLDCSIRSPVSACKSDSTFIGISYQGLPLRQKDVTLKALSSSTPVTINILTDRSIRCTSDHALDHAAPLVVIRTPSPHFLAQTRSSSGHLLEHRQTQTSSVSESDDNARVTGGLQRSQRRGTNVTKAIHAPGCKNQCDMDEAIL